MIRCVGCDAVAYDWPLLHHKEGCTNVERAWMALEVAAEPDREATARQAVVDAALAEVGPASPYPPLGRWPAAAGTQADRQGNRPHFGEWGVGVHMPPSASLPYPAPKI